MNTRPFERVDRHGVVGIDQRQSGVLPGARLMRRWLVSVLLVGIAALSLAACGSSSAENSGSTASSGTSKSGQSGSANDRLDHSINVCTLLPVTTVASITGENLSRADEKDVPDGTTYSCDYTNADGTAGDVAVSVLATDAAAGYAGDLHVNGSSAKQINGLGDKAFSGFTGVEALFGNVLIIASNTAVGPTGGTVRSNQAAEKLIRLLEQRL